MQGFSLLSPSAAFRFTPWSHPGEHELGGQVCSGGIPTMSGARARAGAGPHHRITDGFG